MDVGNFRASVLPEGTGVSLLDLEEEPGGELCIYLLFVIPENFQGSTTCYAIFDCARNHLFCVLLQISNSNGLRCRKSVATQSRGFQKHRRLDFLTDFPSPINESALQASNSLTES